MLRNLKYLSVVRLLVLCVLCVSAVKTSRAASPNSGELSYTFNFTEPVITQIGDYDRVMMEGCELSRKIGEPVLPSKGVAILVPHGKEAGDITYELGKEVAIAGSYYVEPAKKPYPLSKPELAEETLPNPVIYSSSSPYPEKVLSGRNPQIKKGYRLLYLNLHPVKYIPAQRQLSYYERITVNINLRDHNVLVEETGVRNLESDRKDVRRLITNPEVMETYTGMEQTILEPIETSTYVIITTDALAPSFEPLRDYHIAQGVSSKIVTVSEVGGTSADTVRNWIRDTAYSQWNTEYVLIGGDDTVFPPKFFTVDGYSFPVDMYYGNLDTWEDLTTEVNIGRAPVGGPVDVGKFINKTIEYENSCDDYLKKAYQVGEYLGFGGVANYAKPTLEQIRLGGTYDGYYTIGFANNSYFDTSHNFYEMDGSWSKSDILSVLNSGVHTINHLGHGAWNYALKLAIGDLYLTNTNYFFVYSQTCMAGSFVGQECWAETIVRRTHGAFAVVMNAHWGWGESNSTDGPNQRYNRPFWQALFGEGIHELGAMNTYSKEFNISKINDPCSRWCCYELNLFGDPLVRIHDRIPELNPPDDWRNLSPVDWMREAKASIEVHDTESGLNVMSAKYQYSTNGGTSWNGVWLSASCTGTSGTNDYQTISATGIPFTEDGAQNKVKFSIMDMASNAAASPEYVVKLDRTAPSKVGDMVAGPGGGGDSINLSWTAPSDASSGAGIYDIRYAPEAIIINDNTESRIDSTESDWNAQSLTNLTVQPRTEGGQVTLTKIENMARSATAFASTGCSDGGQGPKPPGSYSWNNVNDGNTSSIWSAGAKVPQYVGVQWESNQTISRIVVHNSPSALYHATAWVVNIKDEAGNYTEWGTENDAEASGRYEYAIGTMLASQARVRVTATATEWTEIAEIECYGDADYETSGNLVSTAAAAELPIVSVVPVWDADVPAGTSLAVKISVDNGATWVDAANGVEKAFAWSESNKNLKYSVDFSTSDLKKTPVLRELSLMSTMRGEGEGASWSECAPVTGAPVPGTPGTAESMTVTGQEVATSYYFGLKTTDKAGNISELSNIASSIIESNPTPTPIVTPSVTPTPFGYKTVTPTSTPFPTATQTPSVTPTPLPGEGNIDWNNRYVWSENSGWVNFRPDAGGVTVYDDHLEGFAWSDNVGWVHLKGASYQVDNDGSGNLSGYGWYENVGWINFNPPESQVTIDLEGNFAGFAWSDNIGWIHFASDSPVQYKVKTFWGPQPTPTPPPPPPPPTSTPTAMPTSTPIPTSTPVPTATPSCTPPTPTPTLTPSPKSTPTPSITPSPIPSTTPTPIPPVGNIDPLNKYAWSENSGWVNFRPEAGGVIVYDDRLEGWAKALNLGWVHLKGENYQVNNDGLGNLSGYGWSENVGWIDFNPTESQVKINSEGIFSGFAWNDNIGWINFASDSPVQYQVKTFWHPGITPTPTAPPTTPTPEPTPTPEIAPPPTCTPTIPPPPTATPTAVPPPEYEDWIAEYPGVGSESGEQDDPDNDGWNNLAEYRFYMMSDQESDPSDVNSGGQALPLISGWNLISITVDRCWYDGNQTGGEPSSIATEYEDVAGSPPNWGSVFTSLGENYDLILNQSEGDSTYNREMPWISTLDYISPDQGFWIKMNGSDTLVLNGGRIKSAGEEYPGLSLHAGDEYAGWSLLGFLPGSCFYTEGDSHEVETPSDFTGETGFGSVSEMLRAAFNMQCDVWNQVERIQVIYPLPVGGVAYQKGLPDSFQSLKFKVTGYGLWIKMEESYPGGTVNYREP